MSLPRVLRRLPVRVWAVLIASATIAATSGALLVPRFSEAGRSGPTSRGSGTATFEWVRRGGDAAAVSASVDRVDSGHGAEVPAAGKRTALIVGINHAAGSKPLQGAVRDAELVRDALYKYGFSHDNVVVLTEREATAARIRAELDALAERTPADGRSVFAFAGHSRRRGGTNNVVAADGALIPAADLAARLGSVRAPMWIALPTCYAGAYALPGIVGPGRVTTFASSGNEMAYELGASGSYLIIHMVERAMLGGAAPESVERSFAYAAGSIGESRPDRVPHIDDRVAGEFVLGRFAPPEAKAAPKPPPSPEEPAPAPEPPQAPQPNDQPRPPPQHAEVCGLLRYNCRR